MLKNVCSVFQAEIFAIWKGIEAKAGELASDLETYMIFVESGCHKCLYVGFVQLTAHSRVEEVVKGSGS